ncbi:unnamed protein product [Spirodela intermedia]|uniref:Uncharacterized protein n=1 Tax=Spirodela intermedia TaxID=51605 RepID=A0A7I8JM53_SPIIN|nr:unnamed protein product [Spirodela intermedia]CAA6671247.1 unnamed protein product [Spirodela intermedia]
MEGTLLFWQDMPLEARGAHRLERLGIPSLRIHRTPLPPLHDSGGTRTPLPFHVTGGQPAVGQGVVIHAREGTLLTKLTLLYIHPKNRPTRIAGSSAKILLTRFAEHCY